MDCSTTGVPSNVVHDSPGKDSSSSDDDVPLSKLQKRPHNGDKQSPENTRSLTCSSRTNSKKDQSALYDSSDDEPLIKMKRASAPANKPAKKRNASPRPNGTNNKKADESSDDEPLVKIAKVSSKAAKKPVVTKKKESLDDDDSLDDETLSEIAVKRHSKRPREASRKASPVMKSKRNVARKKVKYAESSSGSSDDKPLATKKRKWTKAPKEKQTLAHSRETRPRLKGKSLKDPSSSGSSHDDDDDDDDVPMTNRRGRGKKPVKKSTKTAAAASGKRRGLSAESSDDEPLINLVKKTRTDRRTKTKASSPKKTDTTKQPRKEPMSGSSSYSSDDEPLIKAAEHPQVTKLLRIILERCDGGEAAATGSQNKTSTDSPAAEHTSGEASEETPEEE